MSEQPNTSEKEKPEATGSSIKQPNFGMAGSVLTAKGPNGENYYVSIIDMEVGPPTQYLQLIDTLYQAKQNDIVHIKLASAGGEVRTGVEIIQAIQNTQAHVITTGMSIVASIAAVIWFCGHERRMLPGSTLMVHMPSGGQFGKTADIEDECHQIQEYFTELLHTVGKGLITEDEFQRIIEYREDTFFSADEINKRLSEYNKSKN